MKNSVCLWVYSFNQMAISINGCGVLGEVGGSITSQIGIDLAVDKNFRPYYLNDVGIDVIILNPEDLAPIGEVG